MSAPSLRQVSPMRQSWPPQEQRPSERQFGLVEEAPHALVLPQWQSELPQSKPLGQVWPQEPQLAGSVWVFTHLPPHEISPFEQALVPPVPPAPAAPPVDDPPLPAAPPPALVPAAPLTPAAPPPAAGEKL